MTWKRNLRFGVLIAVLGVLMAVALHQTSPPTNERMEPKTTETVASAPGDTVKPAALRPVAKRIPAPDFTLDSADGEAFTLSSVKEKGPIIVNFFSTT